jgi:hypothetical protein
MNLPALAFIKKTTPATYWQRRAKLQIIFRIITILGKFIVLQSLIAFTPLTVMQGAYLQPCLRIFYTFCAFFHMTTERK